jgi:hypothetical protein
MCTAICHWVEASGSCAPPYVIERRKVGHAHCHMSLGGGKWVTWTFGGSEGKPGRGWQIELLYLCIA